MILRASLLGLILTGIVVAKGICPSVPYFRNWSCPPWEGGSRRLEKGPWSHEPFCASPTWDYPDNPDKVFCTYTNANFSNGRGITIITTPEVANDILQTPAFTSLDEGHTPMPFPPYEARDLPGRGIGLYANRTIKTGETILEDHPTLIVLRSAYRLFTEADQEFLQWKGLLQLPNAGIQATRNLAKAGAGDEIMDIMQTNGFAQTFGKGNVQHVQLVPEGSRINHDCRPNAYYRFDAETMTHRVWALRDIQPGEEITHSYIRNPDAPCQARRQSLKETWSFDCSCSICGGSKSTQKESDSRLARIEVLKNQLLRGAAQHKHENMTENVDDLLRLYDEERLIIPKIEIFEIGAYMYGRAGKDDTAMIYGNLARQWWNWSVGSNAMETKRVEKYLNEHMSRQAQ